MKEQTPEDINELVGVDVTFQQGDVSVTVPVVQPNDFLMWMESRFLWYYTCTVDGEYDPTDEDQFRVLAWKWRQFYQRKSKAVETWILDLYQKSIDPLITGWSRETFNREYDKYGWTDTYNKYTAANSGNGLKTVITFSNGEGSIDAPVPDPLKVTRETNAHTTSDNKAGSVATAPVKGSGNEYSQGTYADGTNVEADVYTGTFDSEANAQIMPMTSKQNNFGTTASRQDIGSNDTSETTGSVSGTGAELGTVARDFDGKMTENRNKDAFDGSIVERMKEYIRFDITKAILDEFFDENTFFVSRSCVDEERDIEWL